MFAIAFSLLALSAALSIYSNLVMRIRLSVKELSTDKLVWWRLGSPEVTDMYGALFPNSYLPLFSQFAFVAGLLS